MRSRIDNWADLSPYGLVVGSFLLNVNHLWWGLPNGNFTWAHDALVPLSPLSVLRRSLAGGWNSGWFFYKYPIGHYLLLDLLYAPYLAFLRLTGGLAGLREAYPHGFANPEGALTVLALIGRLASALMATGAAWCTYKIAEGFFGRVAGIAAGWTLAASPIVVYYAHTTNLDSATLFWIALASLAAYRSLGADRTRWTLVFGMASGASLATKEQSLGFLLGLSAVVVLAHAQAWRTGEQKWRETVIPLAIGGLAGAVILLLMSNALWNPLGFCHRLQYLAGRLAPEVQAKYVPRASFISIGGIANAGMRWLLVSEVGKSIWYSVGPVGVAMAAGGFVITLVRWPRFLAMIAVPSLLYYFVSLAALPVVAVRYVLPLTMMVSLLVGVCAAVLWNRGWLGRGLVAATLLVASFGGLGVNYLMINDGRYQAEQWLASNVPAGNGLETYHIATFLPRFPARLDVTVPAFDDVSIGAFGKRNPSFVLISVADINRVTKRYDKTGAFTVERPENAMFLAALRSGNLAYREVARFRSRWPGIPDGLIRSLNPELILYEKDGSAGTVGAQ